VDEDVYAEEKNVRTDNLPESTAVKIMNLNKTYPGSRKKLGTWRHQSLFSFSISISISFRSLPCVAGCR
jgi:hypothetical protein